MSISIRMTKKSPLSKKSCLRACLKYCSSLYLVCRNGPTLKILKIWNRTPCEMGTKGKALIKLHLMMSKERCSCGSQVFLLPWHLWRHGTSNNFWDTLKKTLNTWPVGHGFLWSTDIFEHYLRNLLGYGLSQSFRNLYVPELKQVSQVKEKSLCSWILFSFMWN